MLKEPNKQKSPFGDFINPAAAPLLLLLIFISASILTWKRYGDPLHDFGMQLYVPWRISLGERLYTDIFWLYGPLSQLLHGLLFALLGPSVSLLAALNLAILFCLGVVIYSVVLSLSDRFTAFFSVLSVFLLHGFQQLTPVGNFSFLFPYAHEATHGIFLLILGLTFTQKSFRWSYCAVGLCWGLALLTKFEIAVTAVLLAGCVLIYLWRGRNFRCFKQLAVGLLLPIVAISLYFAANGYGSNTFSAVFGAFIPILSGGSALIAERMSFDGVADSSNMFFETIISGGSLTLLFLLLALFDYIFSKQVGAESSSAKKYFVCGSIVFAFLLMAAKLLAVSVDLLLGVTRGLPIVLIVASALLLRFERIPRIFLLWAILSAGLACRLGFDFRVQHYGFFMSLPVVIALVVLLIYVLPLSLRARNGGGQIFRISSAALILLYLISYAGLSFPNFSQRRHAFGTGSDTIFVRTIEASIETQILEDSVAYIQSVQPKVKSLTVLPSGTGLNYYLRLKTPSRFPWFSPEVEMLSGWEEIEREWKDEAPDMALLLRSPTQLGWPDWPQFLDVKLEQQYSLASEWADSSSAIGKLFAASKKAEQAD